MMRTKLQLLLAPAIVLISGVLYTTLMASGPKRTLQPEKGCVFMTVMGEQSSEGFIRYKSDENIQFAVRDGLQWLSKAQLPNGGYGAGSHSAQHIKDPQAVKADPATTAMVGMALLRSGTTLKKGTHAQNLKKALDYLLETIESTENDEPYITQVRNTQIQSKLGANIEAVLAAQFLSSILDRDLVGIDKKRIVRCLDICIARIQEGTDEHGKQRGAGWAGVLQSGMANSALEAAQVVGVEVSEEVLERSRKYQKENYNEEDGSVKTDDGAGIILYSVSGSVRASAKEARKVKADIRKAKAEGKIASNAEVNAQTLEEIGYAAGDAQKYGTAYKVYESAKETAQKDEVLNGFGNNGGEEFLSYLQTGESLLVSKDEDWKDWYDNMSGRILKIQNEDGSWNGHHCITSPVFCTATSLLLLTVEEDIAFLQKMGKE
ncbi:hypothetical protein [Flagellimonas sp. S3867]|uniref:hypothetical protein n=1 Tax=Flagellimonas sp. S3867 TaxID=2768063 RepID=UPI001685AE3D|nr:hypothetical protein [Flagellimonas sp. S3867]